MKHLARLLAVGLVAVGLSVAAVPARAMECGGIRMPNRITVDGTPLVLNGQGIREATMLNVDVYVAGLYLENRSRDARRIVETEQHKRLVLRLVRDVSRDEMVEALRSGFRDNAGGEVAGLRADLQRLASWIPELQEGDVLTFTYAPGDGLEVSVKGRVRGTIQGAEFAKGFFRIWLGGSPPDADLKLGLIGGGCG